MKDRLHQRAVVFTAVDEANETCWRPAADIFRTRTGWLIKYDLAGVKAADAAISITGSQVTIQGVRRDCKLEDGSSYYSMEISYNRFERTIELPCDVTAARCEIQGHDGILTVRLICQGEEP
jgi:HSP20 family protein